MKSTLFLQSTMSTIRQKCDYLSYARRYCQVYRDPSVFETVKVPITACEEITTHAEPRLSDELINSLVTQVVRAEDACLFDTIHSLGVHELDPKESALDSVYTRYDLMESPSVRASMLLISEQESIQLMLDRETHRVFELETIEKMRSIGFRAYFQGMAICVSDRVPRGVSYLIGNQKIADEALFDLVMVEHAPLTLRIGDMDGKFSLIADEEIGIAVDPHYVKEFVKAV